MSRLGDLDLDFFFFEAEAFSFLGGIFSVSLLLRLELEYPALAPALLSSSDDVSVLPSSSVLSLSSELLPESPSEKFEQETT